MPKYEFNTLKVKLKTSGVNTFFVKKDNIDDLKKHFKDIPVLTVKDLFDIIYKKRQEVKAQYLEVDDNTGSVYKERYTLEDFRKRYGKRKAATYLEYFSRSNVDKVLRPKNIESVPQLSQSVNELINKVRRRNGQTEFAWNSKLDTAAFIHASQMAANGFFSSINESNPKLLNVIDRFFYVGYYFTATGENIAKLAEPSNKSLSNSEVATRIFYSWVNSPGFRKNIVSDDYNDTGINVVRYTEDGRIFYIAVQNFGSQIKHK